MPDLRDAWSRAVLRDASLGPVRVTCFAIRQYADRRGRATMGINALANDTCTEPRTVERHVAALVARGYLKRTPGAGAVGRGGTTTLTELVIPERPPQQRRRRRASTDSAVGVSTDERVGGSADRSTDKRDTEVPTTVAESTDSAVGRTIKKPEIQPLPTFTFSELVAVYHALCPSQLRMLSWTNADEEDLRATVIELQTLREKPAHTIEYWHKLLRAVERHPFTGENGAKDYESVGSLRWLLQKHHKSGCRNALEFTSGRWNRKEHEARRLFI